MSLKLIVALDYHCRDKAMALVRQLDPELCALKVGHELFTLLGPDFVRELVNKRFKIFLDLKFHDIPNTVAKACLAAAELGVWMINVHAAGGLDMMQAAKAAIHAYHGTPPMLIAVTVLTSMNDAELSAVGVNLSLQKQVVQLALLAKRAGLDGVVSSALEAPIIKKACGHDFLTVTPGIRLVDTATDDQKRIMTPVNAIKMGSDYLVVGRPITAAVNPLEAVKSILASLS